MPIPGIYILLLLAVAVVLAFVLEFIAFFRDAMRRPVFASVDEGSHPTHDDRVLRRLALVGGAAALLLIAGLITVELAYPDWGLSSIGRNLTHPCSLLLCAAVFCFIPLLCGAKPRQPLLLLCLTLPGLVILPLVWLSAALMSNSVIVAAIMLPVVFFLQPATWILLFIGIGQARRLRTPGGNFTPGGLVRISLISIAYLFGTFS